MAYIALVEYAHRHGRHPDSVRQMAKRHRFETAKKPGRDWIIEENEPYPHYGKRTETTNEGIDMRSRAELHRGAKALGEHLHPREEEDGHLLCRCGETLADWDTWCAHALLRAEIAMDGK